ncbi:MAG TPA: NTP transferase domain-containing protein [Candidatus Omnitrophota bacterium]|nr:NTP transferase domain-containing protein [Candidatus Omnitrophota bacterium]HPD84313.1 NTP transferase domain-containing protein [Candidatus Omnitrophota bacterium]HRZ03170.1 NTP transferase domain-containing protein [Candidatus Omnitrophota bacterium]
MANFKAIILAAGKGVRMNSDLPKVLHAVCGKPMIDYVIDAVRSLGSFKIYVVLGHQSEAVKQHLGKDIEAVIQKKLLGTADAIRSAQHHFKGFRGDVLVVCGDTPLLKAETLKALVKAHRASKAACTFLTAEADNPFGYGRVIRDGEGDVTAICEEKDLTEDQKDIREINVGTYCFKSEDLFGVVKAIKLNKKKNEFYLTDIIDMLAKEGKKIRTLKAQGLAEGLGINTREDLSRAGAVLRKRILKKFMNEGVTIIDPETTYIDCNVKIGRDTVIFPCTMIEGDVVIGKKCLIGPFCHLRPGARIGNTVEVRNFTEVSRATIGDNCFMKHFSFVGDAVIGKRVNIGAGVVTANFDGKQKNFTQIADDAFIGSDSILVAPLKIGKKAITAAGCVVTKNSKVPAGSIVMGVPAKINSRRKLR